MKRPPNWVPLGLAVVACLAAGGCSDRRHADVADIKKTYVEFRTALLEENYAKAKDSLSSDLLKHYPNGEILTNYLVGLRFPGMELTRSARIEFDRTDRAKAVLFPRRQAPTVGQGFIQQSNGWKIDARAIPVVPLF